MSFEGPPPPDRPPPGGGGGGGGGAWVKKSDVVQPKRRIDPSVPRSTPLRDAPLAEQQFGPDSYARKSCLTGSCTRHNGCGSCNYTYTR